MLEEEKEAIEDLKEEIAILKDNLNKIIDSRKLLKCKQSLLNLIQKQQEEIELLKDQKQFVIDEYGRIIKKKDKIIDLMAKAFKQDDVRSVEEIKRYFEKESRGIKGIKEKEQC